MSIWDKMIGCEKNAHLFPIKMTSNIQSMYEFPRFSKSSSQFIERMLSYVALGCSPLGLNNCFPILMSFFFFHCASVPFLSLPIYVMIQLEGLPESICVAALGTKVRLLVHVSP